MLSLSLMQAQPDRLCQEGKSLFQVKIHQSPVVATVDVDNSAWDLRETKGQQECAAVEDPAAHTAKVFVTPGEPWADTIDCSYRKEHTVKDLVGLKDYLRAGTIVSVVEKKVLSWPVSADSEENAVKSGKERRGLKKDSTKGPGPRDKQKKKKKKEKPRELRSDPPIQRILGSERVALDALLATETLVATVCDFGILITEQLLQSPSQEEKLVRSCTRGQGDVAGEGAQHSLPCSILTSIPQLPSPCSAPKITLLEKHLSMQALLFNVILAVSTIIFHGPMLRKQMT
uniref:Uncharacterized protein n=1 Tax=Chrysolophus pictus TaxID=9089 RepID=A0A8C3LC07_CHRPC